MHDTLPDISRLLYRHLSLRDPKRFCSEPQALHVTDLYDTCMRQIALSQQEGIAVEQPLTPGQRLNFDQGIAAEDMLRGYLLDLNLIEPEKPVLRHAELGLVASPDGRFLNGQLLEIKRMAPAIFKLTRNGPLPKHRFQLETYLWLDQTQRGLLFSATWGEEAGKMPFRDQVVPYNVKTGEVVKKVVSGLREAEAGGKLPGRCCRSAEDPRAVLCPVRYQCFSKPSVGEEKTVAQLLGHTV